MPFVPGSIKHAAVQSLLIPILFCTTLTWTHKNPSKCTLCHPWLSPYFLKLFSKGFLHFALTKTISFLRLLHPLQPCQRCLFVFYIPNTPLYHKSWRKSVSCTDCHCWSLSRHPSQLLSLQSFEAQCSDYTSSSCGYLQTPKSFLCVSWKC